MLKNNVHNYSANMHILYLVLYTKMQCKIQAKKYFYQNNLKGLRPQFFSSQLSHETNMQLENGQAARLNIIVFLLLLMSFT